MPKMHDMRQVDVEYATTGPNHGELRQELPAPAANVFRSLEDGSAWKEWLGISVAWTSPEPFGVGTTRTVTRLGTRVDETFLAWEDGRRMNFRFERSNMPLEAFAEDYLVVPTSDTSSELVWSYAFEWGGPLPGVLGNAFGSFFAFSGRRALGRFARFIATNRDRYAA